MLGAEERVFKPPAPDPPVHSLPHLFVQTLVQALGNPVQPLPAPLRQLLLNQGVGAEIYGVAKQSVGD